MSNTTWWHDRRWTLAILLLLAVLNVGVFAPRNTAARDILTALQFDGQAFRAGELWRLLTINLVHYTPNHFYLDVGVFLVLGILYERSFGRRYPWLLLTMSVAVGLSCWLWLDPDVIVRGLSGVVSGLFAAALWVEIRQAQREPERWWWLAPVVAIFAVKTLYETATGESFFSTQSLLGPAKTATVTHNAGIASALLFLFIDYLTAHDRSVQLDSDLDD